MRSSAHRDRETTERDSVTRPSLGAAPKRSRDWASSRDVDDAKRIATQYGAIAAATVGVSVAQRRASPIIRLREHNNLVKELLIQRCCRAGDVVLDLCGGRAGDLAKYGAARVSSVTLVDACAEFVDQGRARYASGGGRARFGFEFDAHAGDVKDGSLVDRVTSPDRSYDAVSCQFSLHYAAADESAMRALLNNATSRLNDGGLFVATFADAAWLATRVKALGARFGNGIHTVDFGPRHADPSSWDDFGVRYLFSLEGALDRCPEFVVRRDVLVRLATEAGLALVSWESFPEVVGAHTTLSRVRLPRQRFIDDRDMSADEQEVFSMYCAVVFRKRAR